MSAVLNRKFNIFAATLHIGGRSSIRNLRTRHAMVTGTHLPWTFTSNVQKWRLTRADYWAAVRCFTAETCSCVRCSTGVALHWNCSLRADWPIIAVCVCVRPYGLLTRISATCRVALQGPARCARRVASIVIDLQHCVAHGVCLRLG